MASVVVEFDPAGAVVQAWGVPVTRDVSAFPRFDGETGEYRRHWGVYGEPPTTRPTEKMVVQLTRASGSAFVVALSPDAEKRWLYLADGPNHKAWILQPSDLEIVDVFGGGGCQPGQFMRPHKWMDVDSRGVVYVGETSTGRRVQEFVPRETGW